MKIAIFSFEKNFLIIIALFRFKLRQNTKLYGLNRSSHTIDENLAQIDNFLETTQKIVKNITVKQ